MQTEFSQSKGYVYILINPSMPNLLKIGKSTRSPETRALELSQATGVPYSFQVVYQALVDNCDVAEKEIHESLSAYRTKKNREFFRIPLNQAIDLIRKVIADKGLKSNNFDIEPYKLAFEEFNSPEALFSFILSDEDKWEQAKLHLKNGYLEDWLKKKGEYDALIKIEKYSDRREQNDFFLSLISFSVVPTKFRLFGYNLDSLSSLYNECQNSPAKENLIELLLSGKLIEFYEGYLKGKSQSDDSMMQWFRFVIDTEIRSYESRKEKMLKILEWKLFPSRFLHFDRVTYKEPYNLVSKIEWLVDTSRFYVPKEILDDALSRNEDKVNRAIRYVSALKEKFCKNGKEDWSNDSYPNGLGEFLPSMNYIKEAQELTPEEYLYFLEGLVSQEEIREISNSYFLPLKLSEHLTEEGRFIDFVFAKEILRYLLLKTTDLVYNRLKFPDPDIPMVDYYVITSEIFKRYENIISTVNLKIKSGKEKIKFFPESKQYLKNKFPKIFINEEANINEYLSENEVGEMWENIKKEKRRLNRRLGAYSCSFWSETGNRKIMQSYLVETKALQATIEEFEGKKERIFEKSRLELLKEWCKQEYIIPLEMRKLFDEDFLSFFTLFHNNTRPKIKRRDLEDKILPSSLGNDLYSDTIEGYDTAIRNLQNILSVEKESFSFEIIPTKIFLDQLIVPKDIVEKLASQDIRVYSQGINDYTNFRGYLLPKETFDALDQEFVLPSDIRKTILGDDFKSYIEAIKELFGWGLVLKERGYSSNGFLGGKGDFDSEKFYIDHPVKSRKKPNNSWFVEGEVKSNRLNNLFSRIFEDEKSIEYKNSEGKKILVINKDNYLIKRQDYYSYFEAIGEEGIKCFCDSFLVSTSNFFLSTSVGADGNLSFCNSLPIKTSSYFEIYKIIHNKYDKRFDDILKKLIKKISSKLFFIPKGLKTVVVKYFEYVLGVNKIISEEDDNFIRTMAQYMKKPSVVLFFKKKEIFDLLRNNYFLYQEFDSGGSQVMYLFNNPAWKKGFR